jgi:LPS-assembly protein
VVLVTTKNSQQDPGATAPVAVRPTLPGCAAGEPVGRSNGRSWLANIFRSVCFSISITALAASFPHLAAQQVTTVAPPPESVPQALPDAPKTPTYPDAVLEPAPEQGIPVTIESDTQSHTGNLDILNGKAVITMRNRTLTADHIEFNADTGDVTLTGHVEVNGGDNDEEIHASRGSFNIHTQTGQFYDVSGSVGLQKHKAAKGAPQRAVYANSNPFLFTGKRVVKTGPREYQIYNGTVTSCQLPRPDWLLSADQFSVTETKASAKNSIFHLLGLPVLWLPVVTHPVNATDRQSGILIPDIGFNSASKGDTVGEQVYWAINRSTDLTAGAIYYSARGYEETAGFRFRGLGQDFIRSHYSSLQDRGYTPTGGTYINQSGTDVTFSGRYDIFTGDEPTSTEPAVAPTRFAGDVEYLSSFQYREAFSSNFNQAVSTDVNSTLYGTHERNGMAVSVEGDRYQGEKRVQSTNPINGAITPEEQVRIFHAPALEFATTDHLLGSTGLDWSLDSSLAGLKRSQPNFTTGGLVTRLDLHPELAYPISFDGWHLRPSIGGRETFYSRSRLADLAPSPVPGYPAAPVESGSPLNRADFELQFDVRPPVLERAFNSGPVRKLLHHDVKHTIEPEITYRYATGIGNFANVLRFDQVDVASNTNELQYGLTQRLFVRRNAGTPCRAAGTAADANEVLTTAGQDSDSSVDPGEAAGQDDSSGTPVCGNREWISWQLAQKYFFDPSFGGAVTNGPRTVLETTLDFSGISFLTRPRNFSPIVSRLRVRTSDNLDVEWDLDYDTCAVPVTVGPAPPSSECDSRFTSNNVYVDVHQDEQTHSRPLFGGISYARLFAPGRSYVEGETSSVAEFNQMRVLFGFGKPVKPGLSAAAYAGIDLDHGTVQYGAIQSSYNWNDNGYKFNFTLANIGSAGNLRHSDQVF